MKRQSSSSSSPIQNKTSYDDNYSMDRSHNDNDESSSDELEVGVLPSRIVSPVPEAMELGAGMVSLCVYFIVIIIYKI